MASEVANIAINATMTASKDSGLGSVADKVGLSGLGMSKTGGTTRYWHSDSALAAPERLDLNDGTLKDAFGDAIAFVTLYAIYIKNNSGGTCQIGAADHPVDIFGAAVADTLELVTGGTFLYLNPTGLTLTPATTDALTIDASAGAYDVIIVGATA